MRKLGRERNLEPVIRAVLLEQDDACSAIDMALKKMAANPASREKCAFKIHRAIAAQPLQICPVQSFVEKVKCELIQTPRPDRQAAPINGQAIADGYSRRQARGFDLQFGAAIACSNPKHAADFLD